MDNNNVKVYTYSSNNYKRKGTFLEWFLNVLGYGLVLMSVSAYFTNSIYIENLFIAFIASAVISLLNITIKPILLVLTLPVTVLTLGLFYPVLNVVILQIADFIMGDRFNITGGFWIVILIAMLISIMNLLMKKLIIEPILNR